MTGSVTLYMNTYFNGVDIPAEPSVLNAAVNTVFNDVYFTRMDEDLKHIDLKVSYELIRDADYLKLSTSGGDFYYLCIPTSLANGVVRMALSIDYLLTLGGAVNCTYISGWQERGHIAKADDVLFGNIASESWVPSLPLENANLQPVNTTSTTTADLDLIMSNVDISALGIQPAMKQETIEGIDSADEVKMYFPCINPVPAHSTPSDKDFMVYDFINSQYLGYSIPGSGVYRITDATTKQGVQKLFSCGQLSLQCSYTIPKEWVDPSYSISAGRFANVKGIHDEVNITQMPFEYTISGYIPKNKKVFATYRNYVITNLASGDTCSKPVYELYNGTDQNPKIWLWSDPCSTGKPYARFKWIKDNPLQYVDCVHGMQWANHQLLLEGASGSMWNSISAAMTNRNVAIQQEQNRYDYSFAMQRNQNAAQYIYDSIPNQVGSNIMNSLQSAGQSIASGDILGGFAAAGNMIYGAKQMEADGYKQLKDLRTQGMQDDKNYEIQQMRAKQALNQNGIELLKNNSVVAPTAMFTPEQNLGLYGYNYFVVYETRKSLEDLKSEDQYYQRFGYNGLHRPLTQQCFKERDHYSYVQAFDINMRGVYNFGMRMITGAIAQLNQGVRVWKELPNAAAYETN